MTTKPKKTSKTKKAGTVGKQKFGVANLLHFAATLGAKSEEEFLAVLGNDEEYKREAKKLTKAQVQRCKRFIKSLDLNNPDLK